MIINAYVCSQLTRSVLQANLVDRVEDLEDLEDTDYDFTQEESCES